jgi:ABC-2 type transport system permease protein
MGALTGTARLTRLALRRDRLTTPVWILGLAAFLGATSAMFVNILLTYEDRVQEAAIPTNNVGLRMLGLTSGPTVGGAVMMRDLVLLSVLAAMMSVLVVVRHTRQGEELGRADVIDATVVGRYADLAAAVLVAVGADAVLAVVLAVSMIVNGLPTSGAVVAGAGIAAVGVVFAGVAAVAVQLASSTRGAIGMASGVLAAAFLLSGIGNMLGSADATALRVESAWPAWLSPIGWAQQMRPFGGDHLWPLLLFAGTFACLVALACALVRHRDVGVGIWPQRRGSPHAGASLLSPAGLVFRLQRGAFLGWAVAMLGFGLIFGAMTEQIQGAHGSNLDFYDRFGGREHLVQAWYASMASMGAMVVAIYLVQVLLRAHADEVDGTLESLLGSGVTRLQWLGGHIANAVGGVVVLLLLYGFGMGVTAGQVIGDTSTQVQDTVGACLVQLPAVLAVGAVVLAVIGSLPRLAVPLAWATVIVSALVGPIFGPPLRLPDVVLDLSPFTHVPAVPASEPSMPPLMALTVLVLVIAVIGVTAVRRRDLRLPA